MRLRAVAVFFALTAVLAPSLALSSPATAVDIGACGGKAYITAAGEDVVKVIDTQTNTNLADIPVGAFPEGIVITPDGNTAYVGNGYGDTISVINLASNTVSATWTGFDGPEYVALNLAGTKLYSTNSGTDSLGITDTSTGLSTFVSLGFNPFLVVANPAGTKAYVSGQNVIAVVDLLTEAVSTSITISGYPIGLGITSDGAKVYSANGSDDVVSVIDAMTDTLITEIPVPNSPYWITISNDDSKVYVVEYDGDALDTISTVSDTVISTVATPETPYPYLSGMTADGAQLYVFGYYGEVAVLDPLTNVLTPTALDAGNQPYDFRTCPFATPPTPVTTSTTAATPVEPVAPAFAG